MEKIFINLKESRIKLTQVVHDDKRSIVPINTICCFKRFYGTKIKNSSIFFENIFLTKEKKIAFALIREYTCFGR